MRSSGLVILGVVTIIAGFFFAAPQRSLADSLLLDRGLPTANLNNAAGNDRSNVAWADQETSSTPQEYWLPGDNFSLQTNANVTDIRVWVVAGGISTPGSLPQGITLLGGDAGGTISTISNSYTSQVTTYNNGQSYQGITGNYWDIYQLDFAVNLNLAANQTYDFFVNQPFILGDNSGDYFNAFLHASKSGLSGSTQTGADNTFLWLHVNGASQSVETWDSYDNGWDKSSDANIQVYGTATPEPPSLLLVSCLLLGFVLLNVKSWRA